MAQVPELDKLFSLLPPFATRLLHILGVGFTLVFGLHHLLNETAIIGILFLVASFCGAGSYLRYRQGKKSTAFFLLYAAITGLALAITCYYHGYRGLIFIYPFSACLFYFLPFRTAILSATLFSGAALLLAFNTTDIVVILRHGAALVITISFAACYAYVMNIQHNLLEKDAHYDSLTGITNRKEFIRWLDSIYDSNGNTTNSIAIFYMDIDDFKQVNDHYGHATGDELLKSFTQRILATIRQDELIGDDKKIFNFARIAGDEFVLAIKNIDSIQSTGNIAKRLINSMATSFKLNAINLEIHISIGVVYSDKQADAEKLLHNADIAMYRAKKNGKNTFYIYDDSISREVARKKDIEDSITQALEENGFKLLYMPIYDISEKPTIAGTEILIRGHQQLHHLNQPERFIPVAETSGQIREIDRWVIQTALQKISENSDNPAIKPLWFTVNISASELLSSDFLLTLQRLSEKYQVNPERIHLEITETQMLPYDSRINHRLQQFKNFGYKLTLDDYGTGYTGFTQLQNFPGHYLKIDRSFIDTIGDNSPHQQMIDVMLSIANIYQLKVIAEGVENEQQLHYLQQRGCHFAQGYLFAKPLEWEELIDSIQS